MGYKLYYYDMIHTACLRKSGLQKLQQILCYIKKKPNKQTNKVQLIIYLIAIFLAIVTKQQF